MESDLWTIGRMARESGLPVSALRFYDGAGVLRPASVDPRTGYRRYRADQVRDARVVAHLRRVGMPLADLRTVLDHHRDAARVGSVLAAHLRRLEDGLAEARGVLSAARTLLDPPESPVTTSSLTGPAPRPAVTTLTLSARDLAAGLRAVRFAVGTDPDLPALRGVLIDVAGGSLRLVASDRFRMALCTLPLRAATGPERRATAPVALVDAALLAGDEAPGGDAVVTVDGARITVTVAGSVLADDEVPHAFPDWEQVLGLAAARPVLVDATTLRRELAEHRSGAVRRRVDEPPAPVMLRLDDAGAHLVDDPVEGAVGFDPAFLSDALAATDASALVLELPDPVSPLAIRDPDRPGCLSVLMPTRAG